MKTYNNVRAETGNIIVKQGDKFDLAMDIYQVSDSGVETAKNLTDKTVRMEVRATKTGAVVLTLASPTTITISGDDSNRITFNTIITLDEGEYYYDIQIDEDSYTIRQGMLIVKVQITDD